MSPTKNRRSRVLLDLPVQLGVTIRLATLWAATAMVTSLVAVLLQFFSAPETDFISHLTSSDAWAPSLIAFAVTFPIAALELFKFSHRFVGPVYRLRSEMRKLAAGELSPPVTFRKDDYWREMADEFNAIVELVHARAAAAHAPDAFPPTASEDERDESTLIAAYEDVGGDR